MIGYEGMGKEPDRQNRVIFNDADVLSSFLCVNSFKTVLDVFDTHMDFKNQQGLGDVESAALSLAIHTSGAAIAGFTKIISERYLCNIS